MAPSKLDRVFVKGGNSDRVLDRLLPFAPGGEIQTGELQKNLEFFNRNPFQKTEIIFSPGSSPRMTDITFLVHEERPIRFLAGTENTGVKTTWEGRLFSGLHFTLWKNALLGSLTYNASYDFHRFQSWSGAITGFLPWKHLIKLSGSYALIHPDTTDFEVKMKGMSDQGSVRYTIPSLDSESFKRDIALGFDFKQMSNILEYALYAPPATEIKLVTVAQLAAEYFLSYETSRTQLNLEIGAFVSPGSFFPHQTKADFANMRAGAKSLYGYLHGSFKIARKFRFGVASLSSSAQIATGPLLPSEQVGMGGYGTVRGYDERQYNADNAILTSVEWAFPSWPEGLSFLVFADGGYGMNYGESESATEYLLSTGPGLRYALVPYLSLRLDLGIRLHEKALFIGDFYKWHFNLVGSY